MGVVTLSNLQPEVDAALTAELTDPDGDVSGLTWQWSFSNESDGIYVPITNATSATYTPVTGDVGNFLRATAMYADGHGEDKTTISSPSAYAVQAFDNVNEPPEFPDLDKIAPGRQTDQTRYVREDKIEGIAVVLNEDGDADGDDNVPEDNPVTATDEVTGGENGDVLTYTLSGPDAGSFDIDPASGQITVGEGTKLDYETKKTYTVTVTATDPSLDSDTITVTIKVVNVDEKPVISESGLGITGDNSIDYDEDETGAVETYTATGEAAAGATWSLEGADAGDFSISSSGVLTFRATPDFEDPTDQGTNNEYNVTVKATSGDIKAPLAVTVTVVNLEEDGTVTLSSDQNEVKVGVAITAEVTDLDNVDSQSPSRGSGPALRTQPVPGPTLRAPRMKPTRPLRTTWATTCRLRPATPTGMDSGKERECGNHQRQS